MTKARGGHAGDGSQGQRRIAAAVVTDGEAPLLRLAGIVKRFPGCLANDRVDLDIRRGEIHALLGENGAGKSTLVKIIYGVLRPDAGEIRWRGEPAHIANQRRFDPFQTSKRVLAQLRCAPGQVMLDQIINARVGGGANERIAAKG